MADVTLSYKGSDILELSDSGSATLKTGGKYCEDDIAVEYVKPSGGQDRLKTAALTLTQDYPASHDNGVAIRNLISSAIGTTYWAAIVSEFPSSITIAESQSIFYCAIQCPSFGVMNGYDVDFTGFGRTYRTSTAQYLYPARTNCVAYNGMTFTIWGWD